MTSKATIASLNSKINELSNSVANQMGTLRYGIAKYLGISQDGKRDIYDIYGYPQSLSGTDGFQLMYRYSRRQGIANRVTAGVAKTCWRDGFQVFESGDDEAEEVLVDEVEQIKKSGFIRKIEAADTLNRIGRLAVLYVGVPDGGQPEDELGVVTRGSEFLESLYFSAYAYDSVIINEQETDPASPRYGLPKYYQL